MDACHKRFHATHDFRRHCAQHICQLDDRSNRRALCTSLNQTDVGAIQAAIERKLLLRDTVLLANLPQGIAESTRRTFKRLNVALFARRVLSFGQQNNAAA